MNDQQMDRMINAIEHQNRLLMAAYQGGDMVGKSVATHNVSPLHHGPGGLFSAAGLDQVVLSTVLKPRGLGPLLPAFPNFDTNPGFFTLTGASDDVGAEPADVCADAPTGYLKGCILTARFGRIIRDTNTIEPGATLMRLHRGDFQDLQLVGSLLSDQGGNGMMYPSEIDEAGLMDNVLKAEMVNVGIRMERKVAKMLWTGSPAASVGEGYKEFPGLDNQIVTGHVDRDANTLCPSVDSLVLTANKLITQFDMVGALQSMMYFVEQLAEDTVGSLDGVFVMRPQVWQELTNIWPCQYSTNGCAAVVSGTARVVLDGRDNITERDNMRRNFRIPINGKEYPVILDSGIHEDNSTTAAGLAPGQFKSSIYFIPLRLNGNMPVTYWQYIDWRAAMPQVELTNNNAEFWTDSGRFTWAYEGVNWCYKLKLRTEPRVILRTPQFAFRIDGVITEPMLHLRDWDPDSLYHVNGGISLRSAPVQNAVWL
jgi:hypothetical protein